MIRHFLVLLTLTAFASVAWAGDCCQQCGCGSCRKVCRLMPETVKTTEYCYMRRCEDFCLHGRSRCIGTEQVCDCRGAHCERVMQPTCCEVLTRAYVVKTPVVKEKCGWKCVVETICCGCNGCTAVRDATAAETQAAIAKAENLGLDPSTVSSGVLLPFDDQVVPVSASEPLTRSKSSRLIDLLLGRKPQVQSE